MVRKVAVIPILCTLAFSGPALCELPRHAGVGAAIEGDYHRALQYIDPATTDRAELYFMGAALLEMARVEEGLKILTELSVTEGAFNGAALEKIAEYSFGLGRYSDIVEAGKLSVGMRMTDPDSFNYRLGQSYFLLDRYEEARKSLLAVQGVRWKAYARHTLALIAYSDGDAAQAIELMGQSLEGAQAHPDREVRKALLDRLRLVRGMMIHQAALSSQSLDQPRKDKLYKLAISQLSLIKQDSPFYADALRTIGWCAIEMNDSVRALASFDTAMGADPDHAHEDIWASGRVLERLGFFEEAAATYADARSEAKTQADRLEKRSKSQLDIPSSMMAIGWGRVLTRLDSVLAYAAEVRNLVDFARDCANLRVGRLDKAGSDLERLGNEVDKLADELVKMDGDLYRYLDIIPARALFPKKDRPRIDRLLNNQDRLLSEIAKLESALMALEQTRAWDRAADERRQSAESLWNRLHEASYSVANAQLKFLEGLKRRVSVRERELVRLVDARKQENSSLREPIADAKVVLGVEYEKNGDMLARIDALSGRLDGAFERINAMKTGVSSAMEGHIKKRLLAEAEEIRLTADSYALDEAQALHLMSTNGGAGQ